MARSVVASAIVVIISLRSSRAQAYRPFDGTDADVAERNVFEPELGPVQYYRQGSRNSLAAPALVLNFGILERTELVIDANQTIALGALEPGQARVGLVDDDILVKYVLREGVLQDKEGLSIAAEGGVLTPEVPATLSFGASLDVITSYSWPWGTFHYNEWLEYDREHRADLFSGVILEGPRDWTVRPVAELFYETDFADDQTASVLLGAIWSFRESLAFDAGLRGARIEGENAFEARLGLTWSVGFGEPAREEPPRQGASRYRSRF